ncbi:MAG: tetratricopeptide repeat protein [Candidatus Melainabacteria bacterium]|nr:tetratricopeptide repeat protein [Candidatus Melainabacteria bacterium]
MKSSLNKNKMLSLSLSGLLALSTVFSSNLNAYALSSTGLSSAQMSKLEKQENFLFGHAKEDKDLDFRLDAVEKIVFGQTHDGNFGDRVDLIDKMIGKSKDEIVLLPQAPKLDSSSEQVAQAPNVVKESYESEPAESISQGNLERATALYSQGNLNEAEKLFKQVASSDSSNVDAVYNLGVISEDKHDYKSALDYYKKALKMNPSDTDLAEAVRNMTQKIAIAPAPAATPQAPARLASANNAPKSPAPVASAPKANLGSLVNEAASAYKSGNYKNAIEKLNRVAKEAPQDASVQFALGQAYKANGETNMAQNAFQKASALEPNNQNYRTAFLDAAKSEKFASQSNSNPAPAVADSSAPAGQLTPFQPVNTGSVSKNYGYGYSSNYTSTSSRLKRAAMASAMGAATGYLLNMRGGSAKKAALTGAVVGGLFGFFSK